MKKICDFIARWMGLLVLLIAAISLLIPASFSWIDTWSINPLLGVIMFGMGLTLSPHDFRIVLSRPKDIPNRLPRPVYGDAAIGVGTGMGVCTTKRVSLGSHAGRMLSWGDCLKRHHLSGKG